MKQIGLAAVQPARLGQKKITGDYAGFANRIKIVTQNISCTHFSIYTKAFRLKLMSNFLMIYTWCWTMKQKQSIFSRYNIRIKKMGYFFWGNLVAYTFIR